MRTSSKNFVVAALFGVALAGCATEALGPDPVNPSDPSNPTNPSNPQPQGLQLAGTYGLDSQFDLVDGVPGPAGDVLKTFIDMTDGPNDPATWLLDLIEAKAGSTVAGVIDQVRMGGVLDGFLNGMLKSYAPDIVSKFIDLGNAFGDVSKKLGLKSDFVITASGTAFVGKHTVNGITYNVNGHKYDYTLADLGISPVVVDNIAVTLVSANQIQIAEHTLPVPYGKVIVYAIDNVVIPMIDPMASNLRELLLDFIDCASIGSDLYDYLQFGNAGIYEGLCTAGVGFAATYVEGKLASLTGGSFQIHGEARPFDSNSDGKVDQLAGGLWEGKLNIGTAASTLAKPAQKFVGTRK